MADNQSPFTVGMQVAILQHESYSPGTVGKVYKNGNFVLTGGTQQFKPRCWRGFDNDAPRWSAGATGNSWSRTTIHPMDTQTRADMAERLEVLKHRTRCDAIRSIFGEDSQRVDRAVAKQVADLLAGIALSQIGGGQ